MIELEFNHWLNLLQLVVLPVEHVFQPLSFLPLGGLNLMVADDSVPLWKPPHSFLHGKAVEMRNQ